MPPPPPTPPLTPSAAGRLLRSLVAAPIEVPSPFPNIPGYRILEKIADGGGGTVYRAIADGADNPVALKLLRTRLGEGPQAQRIWREVELLESIRLPCVPRLLAYGEHDGRLFLVSEFIEGSHPAPSPSHPLTPSPSHPAALLARIADAVQSLHEQGIIHRDLKPSNILITPRAQVVLLDLGLARLLAEDPRQSLTADGQPLGTPAFMAPEQARGEKSLVSTRSDVYALGAIGYFLLTGHTPHDTNTSIHEAVRRVAQEPARPARELAPTLPRQVAAVLEKACAFAPGARYASAAELAADLQRWLRGEPVLAAPPTGWTRLVRWGNRHPRAATVGICASIAAIVVGSGVATTWWLNMRPARVLIDEGSVAIASASGRILKLWNCAPKTTRFARIVDRPVELGGGRVVLTLLLNVPPDPRTDEQLCMWDLTDLREPLWVSPEAAPAIQRPAPDYWEQDSFNVAVVELIDVFPDHPGLEIVTVHADYRSARSLRIYGLEGGDPLFEIWHDGDLSHVYWLRGDRLLVCAGTDHEKTLDELGASGSSKIQYPLVLFAVKPVLGDRLGWSNGRLVSPEARSRIAWYRYVTPATVAHELQLRLESPRKLDLRANHVCLGFDRLDGQGAFAFLVDQRGEKVPDSELIGDSYRNHAEFLRPQDVGLHDQPAPQRH